MTLRFGNTQLGSAEGVGGVLGSLPVGDIGDNVWMEKLLPARGVFGFGELKLRSSGTDVTATERFTGSKSDTVGVLIACDGVLIACDRTDVPPAGDIDGMVPGMFEDLIETDGPKEVVRLI